MAGFFKKIQENITTNKKNFQELLNLSKLGFSMEQISAVFDDGHTKFWGVTTTGAESDAAWNKIRAVGEEKGWWPILFRNSEDALYVIRILNQEDALSAAQILEASRAIDLDAYFAQCFRDFNEDVQTDPDFNWTEWLGEWMTTPTVMAEFAGIVFNVETNQFEPNACITIFNTPHGWEVPAYINYSNELGEPLPQMHVAFLKRWNELCGAELVGIDYFTLQLRLTRPPVDRDVAIKLAWELYFYCPDCVFFGDGTILGLASALLQQTDLFLTWPKEEEE